MRAYDKFRLLKEMSSAAGGMPSFGASGAGMTGGGMNSAAALNPYESLPSKKSGKKAKTKNCKCSHIKDEKAKKECLEACIKELKETTLQEMLDIAFQE